ncbi:hypothetical protein [Glycomyces xiaoerkulensis]|uniref:hypothetical protein n=1 Tax=Glycomyces xiaoerkulensis TaxID=2038139 RepID=UPI000C25FD3A|nr:hypothetical protein [Glycomyces xiaoerkulensis]
MEAVLISVAAAAAGKATEAVVKGSGTAIRQAADLVRRRFADEPELERAELGRLGIEDFAEAIFRTCAEDEGFRRSLSEAVGRPIRIATAR